MPDVHHIIMHSPGPKWESGVRFQEQPGVEQHVAYFTKLRDAGQLFEGGPFVDSTGGMCILTAGLGREDAERLAAEDPTVASGLLRADVRPWLRAMVARTD